MQVDDNEKLYLYYVIVFVGLILVLFSNPFLRYPYDIFAHLIAIDEKYHDIIGTTTSIQPGRLIWHTIWGKIFQILHIGSVDVFFRAKIIHVTQTYIALFSIYYFSMVVLRNLFKDIPPLTLRYISLWSVFIWLTIYATFSMYYHMIWNLWYSVSYQITLPLFFYMTALTLVLLLEQVSLIKRVFFYFQIILIFLFILRAHPMELIYYGMYLVTFSLIYIEKVFMLFKKNIYLILMLISIFIYLVIYFDVEESKLFTYFTPSKIGLLYGDIMNTGTNVVLNYNRSKDVINELMYVVMYCTVFMCFLLLWKRNIVKKIDKKVFLFVLFTSMFVFIPLYIPSAGLFALMTKEYVVHRMYYSSSLFILLPIVIYYISQLYNWKLYQINLSLLIIIVATFIYSSNYAFQGQIYNKNVKSFLESFTDKYAFHLSKEDMNYISKRIEEYENTRIHKNRDNLYFARDDIAYVLKFIYGKRVYWTGRREPVNYHRAYLRNSKYTRYNYILFEVDENFPANPYFK